MNHIPFPEIHQFRQVIRAVSEHAQYVGVDENGDPKYDFTLPRPKLVFSGTVKIHGTNAAICHNRDTGELWYQSREQIIAPGQDNCGFACHFNARSPRRLFDLIGPYTEAAIFGEWCGQGIQKGTAISGLPKMFVVFAVKAGAHWMTPAELDPVRDADQSVYNITQFETFGAEIDFERPELSQNGLGELTGNVEASCPVARFFGANGIGEGIVWRCVTPGWEGPRFWFKVKGEKHSATKVKTLAAVDIEAVNHACEFVERAVTEARCLQGISKLREIGKPCDRTSMGDFLRWVFNDIIKEESDVIAASGLDIKKIGGPISLAAKRWFLANEQSFPL